MLIVAPAAWADDDKKSDDHGGRATTTTQVKSEDRGDDHAEHAAAPAVKVEHENDAVEHANEAAEKAAEQANEVADRANEAAVKAAERAAEAAREAAEEAAEPAEAVPTTFAGGSGWVRSHSSATYPYAAANLVSSSEKAMARSDGSASLLLWTSGFGPRAAPCADRSHNRGPAARGDVLGGYKPGRHGAEGAAREPRRESQQRARHRSRGRTHGHGCDDPIRTL